MLILNPLQGKKYERKNWSGLLNEGIYPLDNGGVCDPLYGADHHDPEQEWYKGKPFFYRRLSASQLLLLPEFREGILRRHNEHPITTVEIHSPFDPDCAIAQFIFKKILAGRLSSGPAPPIYHRLAHYANCYDRYVLPYLKEPWYSLKGLVEGLDHRWHGDTEKFIEDIDIILNLLVDMEVDPNSPHSYRIIEMMAHNILLTDVRTVNAFQAGAFSKKSLQKEFLESGEWASRQEIHLPLETRTGIKDFLLVSVSCPNLLCVYEEVYGQNPDPRLAFIWHTASNTPFISVRPDATAQGVSLFSLVTELENAERAAAEKAGVIPVRWYDGVVNDGTVTFPKGGKTVLTKEAVLEIILDWSRGQTSNKDRQHLSFVKKPADKPRVPIVLGMVGPPASGKSFIVDILCDTLRVIDKKVAVVASDSVRKKNEPNPAGDKHKGVGYGNDIYTDAQTDINYTEVFDRAMLLTDQNDIVVIDATFLKKRHREQLVARCKDKGVVLGVVETSAPVEVLLGRSASRWFKPSISDATPDILERQLEEYEPPEEMEYNRPEVSFFIKFFNSDSEQRMVENTTALVAGIINSIYPATVWQKYKLEKVAQESIKRRMTRLETKKVIIPGDLLIGEELSRLVQMRGDKTEKEDILSVFSQSWLEFFRNRIGQNTWTKSCEGVSEARLLTNVAHAALETAFGIAVRNVFGIREIDFILLGLEVKSLYSNLDFALIPCSLVSKAEVETIREDMDRILTAAGWDINQKSHLRRTVHGRPCLGLKDEFWMLDDLSERDVERSRALLLVSKVVSASQDNEKKFRNDVIIPLFSDKKLLGALVRVEVPKLSQWASANNFQSLLGVKDIALRGLYGFIEILRMRAQELSIEVENALKNKLVIEPEKARVVLGAFDFCLSLRMFMQAWSKKSVDSLGPLDGNLVHGLAHVFGLSDGEELLAKYRRHGEEVLAVAKAVLPEYYN